MYDETVKALRVCEEGQHCDLCPKWDDKQNGGMNVCQTALLKEAADAIEELQKAVNFHKFNSEFWEDKYNSLVDERWIPVTERLPEDLTMVIVFCEDGVLYGLCEHLIADDKEVVEWHDFLHYPITPTHWQPLPQPPNDDEIS
jgi:hypothetical protein